MKGDNTKEEKRGRKRERDREQNVLLLKSYFILNWNSARRDLRLTDAPVFTNTDFF